MSTLIFSSYRHFFVAGSVHTVLIKRGCPHVLMIVWFFFDVYIHTHAGLKLKFLFLRVLLQCISVDRYTVYHVQRMYGRLIPLMR